MLTIAVSTLQKRKKEIICTLTNEDGSVSILFRDNKGFIKQELINNITKETIKGGI